METPERQPQPIPSRKRRVKYAAGGLGILAVLIGLLVWGTTRQGAVSFYMTPTELLAAGAGEVGDSYRVNGKVVPGSISSDGLETTFAISDGDTEIVVVTDRPLPDTFRDSSEVVARGTLTGDRFIATEVLAKCPSKFKARA